MHSFIFIHYIVHFLFNKHYWKPPWRRSGKRTFLPDRVWKPCCWFVVVGGGIGSLLLSSFCCCFVIFSLSGVFITSLLSSLSRWAGFKRSIVTLTFCPFFKMTKVLSRFSITLKGPSYGFWSGSFTASCRRKTFFAVASSLNTNVFLVPCRDTGAGFMLPNRFHRFRMKSELHCCFPLTKNSPGRWSVVPYVSSADDAFKSSL